MSDVSCRVCENKDKNENIQAKELFLGTKDDFQYLFCSVCSSLSIKSIPDNISEYYSKYYSLYDEGNYKDTFRRNLLKRIIAKAKPDKLIFNLTGCFLKKQNDLRLKSFLRTGVSKNSKILDVGCGTGEFLKEISFLGYTNLIGIDPFIREDISKKNFQIYRKDIFKMEGRFDLIMFHHSFEHMEDLNSVINKIYQLLEDDGICLIRLPNVDSFGFKKFRGAWFSIHAPFHYVLPSYEGFNILANKAKLEIKRVVGEHLDFFFLLSINHALGITDYEFFGIRKYLESNEKKPKIPPLFTKSEFKFWKNKAKVINGSGLEDWRAYFLIKK